MAKKFEVWLAGRRVGKRSSATKDYTHAIVGRVERWDEETKAAVLTDQWAPLSYAGDKAKAYKALKRFSPRWEAFIATTIEVDRWTKVDKDGYRVVTVAQAADDVLSWLREFVGESAWEEIRGEVKDVKPVWQIEVLLRKIAEAKAKSPEGIAKRWSDLVNKAA